MESCFPLSKFAFISLILILNWQRFARKIWNFVSIITFGFFTIIVCIHIYIAMRWIVWVISNQNTYLNEKIFFEYSENFFCSSAFSFFVNIFCLALVISILLILLRNIYSYMLTMKTHGNEVATISFLIYKIHESFWICCFCKIHIQCYNIDWSESFSTIICGYAWEVFNLCEDNQFVNSIFYSIQLKHFSLLNFMTICLSFNIACSNFLIIISWLLWMFSKNPEHFIQIDPKYR